MELRPRFDRKKDDFCCFRTFFHPDLKMFFLLSFFFMRLPAIRGKKMNKVRVLKNLLRSWDDNMI